MNFNSLHFIRLLNCWGRAPHEYERPPATDLALDSQACSREECKFSYRNCQWSTADDRPSRRLSRLRFEITSFDSLELVHRYHY